MNNKILHIVKLAGLGGTETIVKEIISACNYNVFCLKKSDIDRYSNVSNYVFFGTSSRWYKYNLFVFLKLYKLVKRKEIKILHVHMANPLFYAILIKFFCKDIIIIYHEHGGIYHNKKLIYFLKKFQRKIFLFLAVSKSTEQELIKKAKIPENKIKILYNFVDLDKFNRKNITWNIKKERRRLRIKSNEFVIGFAGRLNKIKGCEYLIKALPFLDFNYKVLIAGDGSLKEKLNKLTKNLNIQNKVIFTGYVENIEKIYSLLDIYVMPSLSEASPMVFYETQAFGIPIVGSNVPAINEFIVPPKNGLLFNAKNSKDLARKINLIYKNKKLRDSMKTFSRKNVLKYSLDNYIKKLNEIYSNLR
jgi:glycosyltransferase involved in cell wall biosynthesis